MVEAVVVETDLAECGDEGRGKGEGPQGVDVGGVASAVVCEVFGTAGVHADGGVHVSGFGVVSGLSIHCYFAGDEGRAYGSFGRSRAPL